MPGLRDSGPYSSKTLSGSFDKIHQVGNGRLHPVRHLVLADARLDLGIAVLLGVLAVQLPRRVSSMRRRVAREMPLRVFEIQHRIAAGPESYALMARRKKTARPQTREQRLVRVDRVRLREQDDKRRQIIVLAAETIAEPRRPCSVVPVAASRSE